MKTNLEKKIVSRICLGAFFLRFVPFLRFAGVNGSVVRGEANKLSDIDFLIIAKDSRVYTARFFATFLIQLTGLRRYDKKIAGRICLNCYLSESCMNIKPQSNSSIEKVALSNKFLIALIDNGCFYQKFMHKNKWMSEAIEKTDEQRLKKADRYRQDLVKKINRSKVTRPFRMFEPILSGVLGDFLEEKLMTYQVSRIRRGKGAGDETLSTKDQIKLHPKKT